MTQNRAERIQSDVVTDDFLKVFIPTIERETEHINFTEPIFKTRFRMKSTVRDGLDKLRFEAYKQFNRIYIDDSVQNVVKIPFFFKKE
jgi:hypothetical protein